MDREEIIALSRQFYQNCGQEAMQQLSASFPQIQQSMLAKMQAYGQNDELEKQLDVLKSLQALIESAQAGDMLQVADLLYYKVANI